MLQEAGGARAAREGAEWQREAVVRSTTSEGGSTCRHRLCQQAWGSTASLLADACGQHAARVRTAGMMEVKAQSVQMESTHRRVASGSVLNTSVFRIGPTISLSATAKNPLQHNKGVEADEGKASPASHGRGEEALQAGGASSGSRPRNLSPSLYPAPPPPPTLTS